MKPRRCHGAGSAQSTLARTPVSGSASSTAMHSAKRMAAHEIQKTLSRSTIYFDRTLEVAAACRGARIGLLGHDIGWAATSVGSWG